MRKKYLIFVISVICLLTQEAKANANHVIQLNIDGTGYECRPSGNNSTTPEPYRPDQVKRLNDDQISFESRIDISCIKTLAAQRSSYPADIILRYIEQCRQRQPTTNSCQAIYSSPQAECLETVQSLVSSVSYKANQEQILKACQRIAYQCSLVNDEKPAGQSQKTR